jgi:hypothetical protein
MLRSSSRVEAEYLRSAGHNENRREEKRRKRSDTIHTIKDVPSKTLTSKPFNTSRVTDRRA